MNEPPQNELCQTYNLESILNKRICFKNPKNPSCINLVLTNEQGFLKSKTVETRLSDFHIIVVSVFKTSFKKQKQMLVTYRDYKRFDNEKFRESFITYFSTGKNITYDASENLVLHKMAPIKQKHIGGNQSSFINKDIHKAIMTRARFRKRLLTHPDE